MQIEVTEAIGDDCFTVRRLWQLFMHDVSGFTSYDVDGEGAYDDGSRWDNNDTFRCLPYLVRVEGELAGSSGRSLTRRAN